MDSRLQAFSTKKKGLSAEGVGCALSETVLPKPTPSPNFVNSPTGSKKRSSLDYHKKKVGQHRASRCENPHGMYFICKHGHPVFRTLTCHARFKLDCPYCAHLWRGKTIDNFNERIMDMVYPVLVTFTLRKPSRHAIQYLNELVQRCRKYLRRPRCRKYVRREMCPKYLKNRMCGKCREKYSYKIRACVSCIELPNHIHCVWDCSYIPQKVLSEVWETVTKDSFIVDIRKIDQQRWRKSVRYMSKYITEISEYGAGAELHGVHVVQSWGPDSYSKKMWRMACKICGSYFEPLWYAGAVDGYENDEVDFVDIKGPPSYDN